MKRPFLRQVFLFTFLFFLGSLLLNTLIFFLSHIPPKAINLDGLLLALVTLQRLFAWPRVLLRLLWPGENTPPLFYNAAFVVSCLTWGLLLAGLKKIWTAARK